MTYRSRAAGLLASSVALLLAACGGGSGSGSPESASARDGKGLRQAVPAQAMTEATLPSKAARNDGEVSASAQARHASRLFIVQLAEDPALAYSGGIAGYAATKPAAGRKIDPNSPAVINYAGYLTKRHDDTLTAVGGGRKAYSYVYGFNGFAAQLSGAQADRLAATPGVLSVVRNEMRQLDTATTPGFLGLNATGGFWSKAKGENIIIGIVDGGITPEHPSFSDRTDVNGNGTKDGKLGYQQIPGWHGKCEPGAAFNASHCNQKLIGARFYNEGYGGAEGVLSVLPYEFISPRDFDGHGTHTASTAGGNANVPATGLAAALGSISGIAPRARIAAYKVCWGVGGTANAGCSTVDSVAAIDQAIADGVDVINYSISGTRTNLRDPVEIAFMRAAQAGIFVAASAGNSGPANGTVAHPSPWITTVAAGTHPRNGTGSVTLGSGVVASGASFASAVGPAPLVRSRDAGLSGVDAATLALCYGTADGGGARLDPAVVAGKIVVCERGGNALVNKSAAVKAAGGVGMVLANTPSSVATQLALIHSVPTVHTAAADYAAIDAYASAAGATATINQSAIVNNVPAPATASFSSRGPLAATGDLLKPDLIAPGQDILAAVAPYTYGGESFSLLSGTSMSSPHVAGLAALMKDLHPSWSPMAIKSALMTTGGNVIDGPETSAGVIVRQGAGHVNPNAATDPGLVFDSAFSDWLGFLCGTQLPVSFCTSAGVRVIDPSDMNVASIAVGDLPGTQTVTRRVTNVGNATATYTASLAGMAGFTVAVDPPSFTIGRGETQVLSIAITRTTATLNAYSGGQLRLADGAGHVVRVPMLVAPVALGAPAQVSGSSYSVTFGYTGPFTATPRGLVAAATNAGTVLDDPSNGGCSLATPNATLIPVSIPAGTTVARFATFDVDSPGADIDLCVVNSGGAVVGGSGSATSAEEVTLNNPAAGNYTVVLQGYSVGSGSAYKLHTWLLGTADAGNMTVSAPATATTGTTGTITLGFSGLVSGQRYLGSVAYGGAAGLPAPTIVRVDP